MNMRFIYLCSSLISCLFIVSCGDEECHPGFKPFFNGKGQVIESLERVDCFFEKSYYSEGDDLEYLFFCYADDAEEWFSIPEMGTDQNAITETIRACYLQYFDKNGDGVLTDDEQQLANETLCHYADHAFGIKKSDFRKMGGDELKQGQKVSMSIDITDIKGNLEYNYCTEYVPFVNHILWSPHFGYNICGHIRKGYLKAIHE